MIAFECGPGPVRSLVFSPDGRLLAGSIGDGALRIWKDGEVHWEKTLSDSAHALAFDASGTKLAVGGDGRVRHYEAESGQLREVVPPERLPALSSPVIGLCFADHGKKVLLATGDPQGINTDGTGLTLWPVPCPQGKRNSVMEWGPVFAFDGDAATGRVAWIADNRALRFQNLAKPDSPKFSLASPGRRVRMGPRDLLAAACGWKIPVYSTLALRQKFTLEGHRGIVSDIAFGPDERFLVSGSWDQSVKVWDLESGRELKSYDWKLGQISSVAVAPDGLRLACGAANGTILMWDVE